MEEEFNILDRLLLLQVLPAKTNFVKLKILDKLRKDIGFTEEEIKKFNLKTHDDGKVTWDSDKAENKKIEIGDVARELIKEGLKALDEKEELTPEFLGLCERFLEDK